MAEKLIQAAEEALNLLIEAGADTPSKAGTAHNRIRRAISQLKVATSSEDGEPLFLRSSVWREQAENVAETLTKGMRVIAQGYLKQRSYDKDGEKRTVYELEVQEVGPALRFASAKVTRTQRNGNGGGNRAPQPQQSAPQQNQPQQGGWNAPAADPWSTGGNSQPQGNGGGWDQGTAPF